MPILPNIKPSLFFVVLAALTACGDDATPPSGAEGACPLTAPTLLAAAPEFFDPQRDTYYDLLAVGDELLFTFDPPQDPDRVYYKKNRCGGEPEPYSPIAPGLHNIIHIDTPDGPLLYANNLDNEYFIIDRLAVPGADPRRPVLGLPRARMKAYGSFTDPELTSFITFFAPEEDTDPEYYGAAGLNSHRRNIYTHAGDPDVPAWHLGDDIVQFDIVDEQLLLLHLDGSLEWADPHSAERQPLLTGVRHFNLSPDHTRLIWQALGDGVTEPVYLRDLDTGDDREIATNDFADLSWQHAPAPAHGIIGNWHFTADSGHAALMGPDGAFVAAFDIDTGAPIAIPEHLHLSPSYYANPPYISLTLPDPEDTVEALWDLATGDLRVWYRGDAERPILLHIDGDIAEVFFRDPNDWEVGSLHQVDLTTGESHQLFPKIGPSYTRGAREYLSYTDRMVDEPLLTHTVFYSTDIIALDVATGAMRRIVDDAPTVAHFPDSIVFLDLFGDEPGLRAVPRPELP